MEHVDKIISQNEEAIIQTGEDDGYEIVVQKIELSVSSIIPGTTLTVPAYDKDGEKVKDANVPFTRKDVNDLKSKNIKKIFYTLKSRRKSKKKKSKNDPSAIDTSEFIIGEEKLNSFHDEVKKLFKKAKIEKRIEMTTAYKTVDEIFKSIKERENYGLFLYQTKDFEDFLTTNALNVCLLTLLISKDQPADEKLQKNLGVAGLLHDIGLSTMSLEVLKKPLSQYTEEELKLYMNHPQLSCDIITSNKYIGVDSHITNAISQHHEHYNGSGFPKGISKQDINTLYSIITLADTFDYVMRHPVYPDECDYRQALVVIFQNIYKLFDLKIAKVFIQTIAKRFNIDYLFGTDYFLLLNTGEIALIEEETPRNLLQPKLRIVADRTGKKYNKLYRIDLKVDIDRKIIKVQKRKR